MTVTVMCVGKAVEPSPKALRYQSLQQEYQRDGGSSGTGFNIGDTSGRRSGGTSRRESVQEEEERRAKVEKQQAYAREIAAAASAPAITTTNYNSSARINSGRRRGEANSSGGGGGLTLGEDAKTNKRLAQQEYHRQLQEASSQVSVWVHMTHCGLLYPIHLSHP